MKLTPANTTKLVDYARPLLATTLIASSLCQLITPVLAAPPPAIKNQATATYEDPENPADPNKPNDPNRINATSNIIEVAVQEVAGITIKQQGITDETGKDTIAKSGEIVYFRFDVTNIGNDGTKIFLPNKAGITGAAQFQKVQYFNPATNTWQDVPEAGFTSDSIAPQGILQIRVAVKVNDGASGKLAVSVGKTTEPNQQNQEQTAATKNPEDIFTVDSSDPTDTDGAPVNGIREAMATQEVTIDAQPQAFATLKKIAGVYAATDNSITYGLSLKVEDTVPSQATNVVAADLVGAVIPGLGNTPGILVSDAVPIGTKFSSVVLPTGWVAVYQYGTEIGATDRADRATWSTAEPTTTNSGTLRRVGFFLANGRIAKGTSVTGFQLKLTVINPLQTTSVANIAQLFGNSPANPGDPNDKTPNPNLPVVDESGDNDPNNYNPDGTPGARDPQDPTKPAIGPGIVDPSKPVGDPRNPTTIGQDLKGDNSGDGVGGEFVTTTINPTLTLLNGPKDRPEAVGQPVGGTNADNNNDFTNKSAPVQPGIQKGNKFDPEAVGFLNTVQNSADFPADIKVLPTIKADELLPEGTKVTLKDPSKPTDPGVSFTVNGGKLVPDDGTKPVLVLLQVPGKGNADYTTIIDLPAGTDAIKGYPVELTAFVDLNNDNQPGTDEPKNKTLDRAYTGFIDLLKESRILGTDKQPLNEFSPENKLAKPGEYIEYRIKFTNISVATPIGGTGNKPLNASNFTIVEDGTVLPNNWAALTDHEPGSAKVDLGTLQLTPPTDNAQVTKYVNTVGTLAPQASGTFSFIRKVR